MTGYVLRPAVRAGPAPAGMFTAAEYKEVEQYYREQPPTPLHSLPELARRLGIAELLLKDESSRAGLNAFKILGVDFALSRLRRDGRLSQGTVLACATDGNHGRAVARTAARMGLASHVYLPSQASRARIQAIAGEGAEVHITDGNYDDAVRQAARDAGQNGWLAVSDTSWPGYEEVPRMIMCGYTQLIMEASRQWTAPPDAVLVQAGVGGLACAVGSWFAQQYGQWRPYLICCQAERSACIVAAARGGAPVALQGSLETLMDCLSAGEVSHSAWPFIHAVYDAYMAVADDRAVEAAGLLRQAGIGAGFSGACGLASLLALVKEEPLEPLRLASGVGEATRVLLILTEGPVPG